MLTRKQFDVLEVLIDRTEKISQRELAEKAGKIVSAMGGIVHYPPEAYRDIFIVISIFAFIGVCAAFFVPETYREGENGK